MYDLGDMSGEYTKLMKEIKKVQQLCEP